MCVLWKLYCILIIFNCVDNSFSGTGSGRISNKRRCADADCSIPISYAKTHITYNADDIRLLSFPINEEVTVYSKDAGDNPTLWEIEIKGRRGYAPKSFLTETKVLVSHKKLQEVSTGREENVHHFDKRNEAGHYRLLQTPELPPVNSKGFFSTIVGASANSVPNSDQRINPQTSSNFQVVEGTTIYNEPTSESTKNSLSEEIPIKPTSENSVKNENEGLSPHVKNQKDISQVKTSQNVESKENIKAKDETETSKAEDSGDSPEIEVTKTSSGSFVGGILNSVSNLMSHGTTDAKEHVKEAKGEDEVDDEESDSNDYDGDNEDSEFEETKAENNEESSADLVTKVPSESEQLHKLETDLRANYKSEENNVPPDGRIQAETILEIPANSSADISNASNESEKTSILENKEPLRVTEPNEGNLTESIGDGNDTNNSNNTTDASNLSMPDKPTEDNNQPVSGSLSHGELSVPLEGLNNDNNEKVPKGKDLEDAINKSGVTGELHHTLKKSDDIIKESSFFQRKVENYHKSSTLNQTMSNGELEGNITDADPVGEEADDLKSLSEHKPTLDSKTLHLNPLLPVADDKPNEEKPAEEPVITESTDLKSDSKLLEGKEDPMTESSNVKSSSELPKAEEVSVPEALTKNHNMPSPNSETQSKSQFSYSREEKHIFHIDESVDNPRESTFNDMKHIDQATPSTEDNVNDGGVGSSNLSDKSSKNMPIIFSGPSYHTPQENSEVHDSVISEDSLKVPEIPLPDEHESNPESSSTEKAIESGYEIKSDIEKFEYSTDLPLDDHTTSFEDHSPVDDDRKGTVLSDSLSTLEEDSDSGLISSIMQIFAFSSPSPVPDISTDDLKQVTNLPTTKPSRASSSDEICQAEGLGEGSCESYRDISWKDTLSSADVATALGFFDNIPVETTLWLIITGVVVLIFSLGYYYIEAHRRDGHMAVVLNKLEKEVLILRKENSNLEDKLLSVTTQLEDWSTNSSENDALVIELKQELEETKAAKSELEEQVAALEREVETVTENGLEMHRLLEESLSSQDGSQVLLSTVETLRERLERQEDEIAGLSQRLSNKTQEVEELEKRLEESAAVARDLEDKIISISRQKDEEVMVLKDQHRQLMVRLEEIVETKALEETRMSTEISKLRLAIEELQKTIAEKDSELDELKEIVKDLRATDSNDKIEALFDTATVRAQLRVASTERDEARERLSEEEGARKLLEGHMKKVTQEVTELKFKYESAEKEKIDALTKLQVLSNYFKEKEQELQKELGMQESMWLQKQSDDHTIYEQMRSLREENEKYKLQNESLKKEIVEQEASFKIQIANVEQKSHENWVASRQADRKLKEVQQEAAQLRNRLTSEKAANYNLEDGKQNISESNGEPSSPPPSMMFPHTSSPPFMMYGPPGDFVPPPPLVSSPYHSDPRPPPLGRISSPPLDHSRTTNSPPHLNMWTPPPPMPYPPYDYPIYGHHSPSPPPPMAAAPGPHRNVHKPQPREMSREQKDHSPNYSPETDKAVRKNKR